MITEIETYFTDGCGRCGRFATPDCSARRWGAGLSALRRICLDAGLQETLKWGHPCYAHEARNIAILGAFRTDFRITFFQAALLNDPHELLEKAGPNTAHAGTIRFVDPDRPAQIAPVLRAYLAESVSHARSGRKAARTPPVVTLPQELVRALADDPELSHAFHALTPGRQRSYVIKIDAANKTETKQARIHAFRGRILAGKGATER